MVLRPKPLHVEISLSDEKEPRKDLYKTVWEIKQRRVLDMAADRGAYIDQSQSLSHGGGCCFFWMARIANKFAHLPLVMVVNN